MGNFPAKSSMAHITVLFLAKADQKVFRGFALSWRRLHVGKFSGIPITSAGRGGRQTSVFRGLEIWSVSGKYIVQNPAVELVVVCMRILRLTSLCAQSARAAFSGLIDFLISAPLSHSTVTKLLYPCQTKPYIRFFVL